MAFVLCKIASADVRIFTYDHPFRFICFNYLYYSMLQFMGEKCVLYFFTNQR